MSGGVHVKSAPRNQAGSGIPTPRSMLPSPKPDPQHLGGGLSLPSTQIPLPAKNSLTSSSPISPASRDLLRDTTLRNQFLLQRSSVPLAHGASKATCAALRCDGTRSAYSSPSICRKVVPRSKDTMDTPQGACSLDALRELRRNGNSNRPAGASRAQQRRLDNTERPGSKVPAAEEKAGPSGQDREQTIYPYKLNNANLLCGIPAYGLGAPQRSKLSLERGKAGSLSDEEMETPEALSPATPKPTPTPTPAKDQHDKPPKGKSVPGVNMAAIAPFRYRLVSLLFSPIAP